MSLDEIDIKVMQVLMAQGRITWAELASTLGLSAPATADRVRRLEERGVIQGYAALIDAESVGCDLTAFITVSLAHPDQRSDFLQKIQSLPEIQECHHVTGEDDYWMKVRCHNTKDLERLISDELKGSLGYLKTRTTIALSTVKETVVLPIEKGGTGKNEE
jgi:Lrp/AsnC family transcriptional regulator, leucine-responsive regulatory protein